MQFPNIPIQQVLGLVTREAMSHVANKAFTPQVLLLLIVLTVQIFLEFHPNTGAKLLFTPRKICTKSGSMYHVHTMFKISIPNKLVILPMIQKYLH